MILTKTSEHTKIQSSNTIPREILPLFYIVGLILICAAAGCATTPKPEYETRGTTTNTPIIVRPNPSTSQTATSGPTANASAAESADMGKQMRPASAVNNQLREQAEQAMQNNEQEQAVRLLERALRIDPRDPATYYVFAKLRKQQSQFSAALQLVDKALSLQPEPKLETKLKSLRDSMSDKIVDS